ncbi:ASCH domain-containing protein [Lactobacillus sp. XV13L]|nr:ASCH domain-containing protein [Lactobacillus sp. XV13L]
MMNRIIDAAYDPFLPTLLMSLHQEYVRQILQGEKVIEYRKRFFKDGFQAFVYTTGPNGGIELFIKCAPLIRSDATSLAKIGRLLGRNS